MSRYTTHTDEYAFAWGFDFPLGSYYFQKFHMQPKKEEEECIFSIDSYYTTLPHPHHPGKTHYTNGEILEIMESEMKSAGMSIPEEHLSAIAGDITF